MKKIIIFLLVIVAIILLVNGLSNKQPEVPNPVITENGQEQIEQELTLEDGTYHAQANTPINWQGRRPLIQGYMDSGIVAIKSGSVEVKGNAIISGEFIFDMTTISVQATSGGEGREGMLSNHLKSEDFFNVEVHPEARLVIHSIVNGVLDGALTIKGNTNPVNFPVQVSDAGDAIIIAAVTELDRTLWDVQYASGRFFDNLAERMIDDNFTVTINITLTK